MADNSLPPADIKGVLRAVFFRWQGWALTGLWSVWGVLSAIDSQTSRMPVNLKTVWDAHYKLPSLGWRTWVMVFLAIITFTTLQGAYSFARGYSRRYEDLTAHRIIPHVMRQSSQVYLGKWASLPVVKANIALKFENIDSNDIALKDVSMILYTRGTWGWKGWVEELPIRGPKPDRLYEKPMKLWEYDDPRKGVSIAGLRIKSRDFPSDAYFYLDDRMIFDDYVRPTNRIHFLRLTVEAVAQKPYIIDIDVDWTQPGLWVLSSTPVFDTSKTIRCGERPPRLRALTAKLIDSVTRPVRVIQQRRKRTKQLAS